MDGQGQTKLGNTATRRGTEPSSLPSSAGIQAPPNKAWISVPRLREDKLYGKDRKGLLLSQDSSCPSCNGHCLKEQNQVFTV